MEIENCPKCKLTDLAIPNRVDLSHNNHFPRSDRPAGS